MFQWNLNKTHALTCPETGRTRQKWQKKFSLNFRISLVDIGQWGGKTGNSIKKSAVIILAKYYFGFILNSP